jgi:Na+/proline symporter
MWVLLGVCSVFIVIGFLLSKKVKNTSDFLLAGRNLPMPVLAATIAAANFGGGALVGGVQWGAEKGFWPGAYNMLGMAVGCFVSAYFAKRLRAEGDAVTATDYMGYRYEENKFLRAYQSVISPFSALAIIASQLISFGSLATAFGIQYSTAVVIGTVVVILYTFAAGMWGVAATDFVQLLICLLFLPVVGYASVKLLGSPVLAEVAEMSKAPFFPTESSVNDFFYAVAPYAVGTIFSYDSFMRYQCAKRPEDARNASIAAGVILLLMALPISMIGVSGARLFPELKGGDVLPKMISSTLSPLMATFFIAVIIAAIMSTVDMLMTSLGALFVRDIYNKLLNPDKNLNDLKGALMISKVVTVLAAVLAAAIALSYRDIIRLLFLPAPLRTGSIAAPMIIGFLWKGATTQAAGTSVLCSAFVAILYITGVIPQTFLDRTLFPFAIGVVLMVVVSKLDRAVSKPKS